MKNFYLVLSVLIVAVSQEAQGAVLSEVPMQGEMVMPALSYHESDGSLSVKVMPIVPQLTPLLVSDPGASFDPADPWFETLDPSREGLSFSRRYGFVMAVGSDPVPEGTAILLRKLSSTPGLNQYRYGGMGKVWAPVFGTGGSSNALVWDGVMFHPAFTAASGTNAHQAVFEAELIDTASGSPVSGARTPPFQLDWTNVPDGRPTLHIGPGVVVRWPASANNYVLETVEGSLAASWALVTNVPVAMDTDLGVTIPPGTAPRFFRMRLAE